MIKYTRKKFEHFFNKENNYNKKENIMLVAIWVIFIMMSFSVPLLFSVLVTKISIVYFMICMSLALILVDDGTKLKDEITIVFCIPYLLLFMLSDTILKRFVPYRGKDKMKIRAYKIKVLTRKVKINKLKFWKR